MYHPGFLWHFCLFSSSLLLFFIVHFVRIVVFIIVIFVVQRKSSLLSPSCFFSSSNDWPFTATFYYNTWLTGLHSWRWQNTKGIRVIRVICVTSPYNFQLTAFILSGIWYTDLRIILDLPMNNTSDKYICKFKFKINWRSTVQLLIERNWKTLVNVYDKETFMGLSSKK